MPLDKLNAFTKKVQDLSDKPNATMSAAEVKAQFDAAPNELRLAFNQLIDDLSSVGDGDSGADNIAVTAIAGLTGATVQAVLEALKSLVDEKTTNNGNHAGTWQNLNPIDFDSGFQAIQLDEHKADYLHHTGYAVATGSANAYIATLTPALSAYAEGVSLRLKINSANTAASTVNVDGLGVKAIKNGKGNDVATGNLKAGVIYTLAYDGMSFILQGEGGGETISGTATSSVSTQVVTKGDGTTENKYTLTVAGLPFAPVIIEVFLNEAQYTVYKSEFINVPITLASNRAATPSIGTYKLTVPLSVTNTSFVLPVNSPNLVYSWRVVGGF